MTLFLDEQEQDNSCNKPTTHEDQYCAATNEPAQKPSQQELRDVYDELRQIKCTPGFQLNERVQRTVVQYWQNVPGAIAYLKEALRTWKRVDCPEAVFVAACKNGKKPEKMVVSAGFNEWYDWAYKKRLVQAAMMKDGVHCVILANNELVAVPKAMQLYPVE